MKSAELLEMGVEELESRLEETRREVFNLRFQLATGQLDNSSRLREARKDVARLLTILREREIDEAEANLAAAAVGQERARRRRADKEAARTETAGDHDAASTETAGHQDAGEEDES
jgi:large subunit ribosomal protein L29